MGYILRKEYIVACKVLLLDFFSYTGLATASKQLLVFLTVRSKIDN
uniref:Uncharacterized protein n=1 Tax=Arundo donax TaxID=35708 RepID=A0A0A9H661_ARUDO